MESCGTVHPLPSALPLSIMFLSCVQVSVHIRAYLLITEGIHGVAASRFVHPSAAGLWAVSSFELLPFKLL